MPIDDRAANRDALEAAGRYILAWLKRRSLSAEMASHWRLNRRAEDVILRNDLIEAREIETNGRHPLFGNRSHWYAENVNHPTRTGMFSRTVLEAADFAEEQFADAWLKRIAIDSPYFEYR